MNLSNLFPVLAVAQGAYYLVTGLWPLISPRSFQKITGPKTDVWLVKTVGVLVSVIGGVLILAGARRQTTREIPLLAAGSAAGLAAIDVVYASRGRIAPIYLADAAVEGALILAWAMVRRRGRSVPLVAEVFRPRDETEADVARQQGQGQPAPVMERERELTHPRSSTGEAMGL